jgi:hypothetical protein
MPAFPDLLADRHGMPAEVFSKLDARAVFPGPLPLLSGPGGFA